MAVISDSGNSPIKELKWMMERGLKIDSKDDLWKYFVDDNHEPLLSDEIIEAMSLNSKIFDDVILNLKEHTLRIHVINPDKVSMVDTLSLFTKFRPDEVSYENGYIEFFFD